MKKITQAVILAGGLGTRLRPLTLATPKPMIEIHGKPFLEYILTLLKKNNIREILILTGYFHEKIENYFRDGSKWNLSISYSYSPVKDETGTRLKKAKQFIDENFLLLYSDNYWPLQLKPMISFYKKMGTLGLVTTYANREKMTRNNMLVNEQGLVEIYDKTRKHPQVNSVDIGYFILHKSVLDLLPLRNCSFEEVVLTKLVKKKQLAGYRSEHKYYGLSNLDRIPVIKEFFIPKKVVFLDRDGVINKKAGKAEYIQNWKDFKFLPKVKSALKLLKRKGYTIFIVTNQPGIARKMLSKKQLDTIHGNFLKEMKKIDVDIKEIFVCSHGWDDGCFCRKPNPGMFFEAGIKHAINLYESYCIGDDQRDIIAGQKAGCKTFLVSKKEDLYTIVKKHL